MEIEDPDSFCFDMVITGVKAEQRNQNCLKFNITLPSVALEVKIQHNSKEWGGVLDLHTDQRASLEVTTE